MILDGFYSVWIDEFKGGDYVVSSDFIYKAKSVQQVAEIIRNKYKGYNNYRETELEGVGIRMCLCFQYSNYDITISPLKYYQ